MTEFEVVACHGDHAGKAHLSIRSRSGAEVAIRHMPFETDPGTALPEEQARILAKAAGVALEAAKFLEAESRLLRTWPVHCPTFGPSPGADQAPNAFGHPIRRV